MNDFDLNASLSRCRNYRKPILAISQQVLTFSCLETSDVILPSLFTKGHGWMAQYAVLHY